jgi:hypothetical protein
MESQISLNQRIEGIHHKGLLLLTRCNEGKDIRASCQKATAKSWKTIMKKIDWKNIGVKDLAALISDALRKDGIEVVLVGGACVTIYSDNRYVSYDLDYSTWEDKQKVKKSLEKLGFHEKNKHFCHPDCPYLIEIVSPPVAVGNEIVNQFQELQTPFGSLKMLRPLDCVKDRLASFYHWDDKQALNQAIEVCSDQNIDIKMIKHWSIDEGFENKFNIFLNALEKHKG